MPYIQQMLAVISGGAVGALIRYIITLIMTHHTNKAWPIATFSVNLVGCFFIGFFSMLFEEKTLPQWLSFFIITGILAAFTTFSTFAYDSVVLFQKQGSIATLLYMGGSCILGVGMVIIGRYLASWVL